MPTPSEDAALLRVEAQRQWFWTKFSEELGAVTRLYSSDADLQRLEMLNQGVLWLHNAIWRIHRVRLQAQPSSGGSRHVELNEAATSLLFWFRKFDKTFTEVDFKRMARDHERSPSLGGLMRASYAVLCRDLALKHIELLKSHRPTLQPRLPNWTKLAAANTFEVTVELAFGLEEGRCFYTDGKRPDVSQADVVAVNAAFDAISDFNFAGHVATGKLWQHSEANGSESKDEIHKRVASLEREEKKRTKRLTPKQENRKHRIKFCCPRTQKGEKWSNIYSDYIEKYPQDKAASPDSLQKYHDRKCAKCLEDKA